MSEALSTAKKKGSKAKKRSVEDSAEDDDGEASKLLDHGADMYIPNRPGHFFGKGSTRFAPKPTPADDDEGDSDCSDASEVTYGRDRAPEAIYENYSSLASARHQDEVEEEEWAGGGGAPSISAHGRTYKTPTVA